MLNETTQLIESQASAYVSSLVIFWIFVISILPLIAFLFKSKKTNWGNFWGIWGTLAILSGIVLVGLIMNPEFIAEKVAILFQ